MTPPNLSKAPGGSNVGSLPLYDLGSKEPSDPKAPSLGVAGSSFVRLDSGSESFATVEDLLNALGDAALFASVANAKYQPERNKKYLKVTLALMEIRKYVRGDEKNAAEAPKRIATWLNDPELLGDTLVAHQARVNLIKALKKAPKGQGIDEGVKAMLEALSKNYAPKAAESKAPEAAEGGKAKDASTVVAELSDEKLFGEKLSVYNAKRNKEYLDVTLAIMEIRKFVRGDVAEPEAAKLKIAAWLNQYVLLTDAVPHQARVNLIKALDGASGSSESWNKGVAAIAATLKAKYEPTPPEKSAEPEAPKDEKKPAPEKPKEEPPKDEPADKPKEAEKPKETAKPKELQSSYAFSKFTFAAKEKREDTDLTLVKTIMALLRPAIDPIYEKNPGFGLECEMQVKVNNDTGEGVEVMLKNIKVEGNAPVDEMESAFQNMAERFHSRYRFKRSKADKDPVTIYVIPLTFKKK